MTDRMYRFEVYEDAARQWRWKLVAPNNKVVCDSGESYQRRYDCKKAAQRVQDALAAGTYIAEER